MKKFLLLATAFAFSLTLMAQNETKTKPHSQLDKRTVLKKDQTTPVKVVTTSDVKPQTTQPIQTQPVQTQPVQTQPAQPGPSPDDVIKVNTVEHNFGKIKQGVPVTYSFQIKNISDKPIVVENTYASCGCTTPDKITEPILPGATAPLKVQYNAAAVGPINKDIHIKLAGIAQEKLIKITGEVLPPEPVQEQKSNN